MVHKLLLIALGTGSLVLLPSIFCLFRVFKGHTFLLYRLLAILHDSLLLDVSVPEDSIGP